VYGTKLYPKPPTNNYSNHYANARARLNKLLAFSEEHFVLMAADVFKSSFQNPVVGQSAAAA
jgi:hypothetical protein